MAQRFGFPVSESQVILMDKCFVNAFKKMNTKHPNFGFPNIQAKDWWKPVVYDTFVGAEFKLIELKPRFDEMFDVIYEQFAEPEYWEQYPEVTFVLDKLRKEGHILGVISNFDNRLHKILEKMKLSHYFDFVICSRDFGYVKPQKQIFEEAIMRANVPNFLALHVGDSKVNDYEGAKNAGLKSLLLVRDSCGDQERANKEIIFDLKQVLQNIVQKK